jgi:hypothetical protein
MSGLDGIAAYVVMVIDDSAAWGGKVSHCECGADSKQVCGKVAIKMS